MKKLRTLLFDLIGPSGIMTIIVFMGGILILIIGYQSTTIWGSVIRICGYVILACAIILFMESIRIMKKMRKKE